MHHTQKLPETDITAATTKIMALQVVPKRKTNPWHSHLLC
jgi:hypothetical protein